MAEAYFFIEHQLTESMIFAVGLVMAKATHSIMRTDIEAINHTIYAELTVPFQWMELRQPTPSSKL